MGITKILGIVLIVTGVAIAYTGYEMSGSLGNQIGEAFSGSPSDSVMARYIAGLVCLGAGVFLVK